MTNTESRKQARIDIIRVLKDAGLLEGSALTEEKFTQTKPTCFWHGVVKNDRAKAKDNYVTWYIPASAVNKRADNTAFLREVTIAIDVFSKRSFDMEQNHKLLETLENAFEGNGYEVEFADEIFEQETGLYHYPITIYKLY